MEYLSNNAIECWYLVGSVIMMTQMLLGGTKLLFFIGFAAFTVALTIRFGPLILDSLLIQLVAFFIFLCLWSIILWKPLTYLMNLQNINNSK